MQADGTYDDTAVFNCIDALREQIAQIQDAIDDGENKLMLAVRDMSVDLEAGLQQAAEDVGNLSSRIGEIARRRFN